jgi:ATP-binding cassette subfamily B protein
MEPWLLKRLFDGFAASKQPSALLPSFLAMAGLLAARELTAATFERCFWRTRLSVNFELLHVTVERLHQLPLTFHRNRSVGATMTEIERGIAGAMTAFTELFVQLLPALIYLGTSTILMFAIAPQLSLVVLLFAPLPAVIGARAAKEQTERERALLQRWTKIFARFNEVLSGITVVKSFVMEDEEKRRFLDGVKDANGLVLRGVATDARVNAAKNAAASSARLCALGLGGWLVTRHEISLGTLIAFVACLGGMFSPIASLTGLYQSLRRADVALRAIVAILDAPDSVADRPSAQEPGKLRGEIEFRCVSFGYRSDALVLRDVDFKVRAGQTIALVGESGAGKSTLMSLLQRFYEPNSGAIFVDGTDVRELSQRSLRRQIGIVLQDGMLFSGTIRDNIAFGRRDATLLEVQSAAKAANAHEFITALPRGYDSEVGERAVNLSGGERQRLAIARAVLKDAPILVLDEATSALDAESEDLVQRALQVLTRNRTTFVIAHRLSTITTADRIFVFRQGRICESGSHLELMAERGYYASLVHKQWGNVLQLLDVPEKARRSSLALGAHMTPPAMP